MVIWIIGLAGSGKTYLSKKIKVSLKKKVKFIHIDGDRIRKIFSHDLGYNTLDRQKNAERISKLTKFLAEQNNHVIVSVLSNFPYWLKWNRKNIKDYFEIYIKCKKKTLFTRNKKNLYKSDKKNVVGKDINFNEPKKTDFLFNNNFKNKEINIFVEKIIKQIITKIEKKNTKIY